jgi:gluconokinase
MQPYILGIDIGTGSTKSIAVNADGNAFSVVKFPYAVNHPKPGYSEQNPDVIWRAFTDSIRSHVQKLKQPPLAICLSSVLHSVIPVTKNGIALADMITWADARSEAIATRIKASSAAEDIYRKTGTPLHAMSPLCKIIWLRENNKERFEKSYKFISIKEFIWFKLFNEFKVDISIASATGLLNIESNQWDKDALVLADITEDKLSIPVSPSYLAHVSNPEILKLLNIPAAVSFIIGASDGCFANLGSFVINENEAAVTIGTSGAVRVTSKKPLYNFDAMTFNYKLDEETFICGGATNNGGNALQWFLKNMLNKKVLDTSDYEELFLNINNSKAGADGLIFLPYLNGERAPLWDTKSSAAFFGMKAHHTQSDFSRAVVEGICYALNDVLLTLQNNREEITQLHVSGGFVASKAWMQILADVTGKKICLIHADDASAIGAAYFGLKIIGMAENYNSLFLKRSIEVLEPNQANHNLYKNYFKIYKNLYPILKDSMHQLHKLNQ